MPSDFKPDPAHLRACLAEALDAVRAGRYEDKLVASVKFLFDNRQIFRDLGDELSFARTHSVHWEIYDQMGDYDSSIVGLEQIVEEEYLPCIKSPQSLPPEYQGAEGRAQRKLLRQKVMCCLAYGFALYRKRDHITARDVLDSCRIFIEKTLIYKNSDHPFPCWGTRARYHYFYGQLLRAEQQYHLASEQFVIASDYTRRRLDQEKDQGKSADKLHIEQLFANHCVGKVLAFGFGWSARLQGSLSLAWNQLQSARVVLWDSQDEFLKGQLEWLSCSVRRAQKGISLELEELIPQIKECRRRLDKHTDYYVQASREHGILLLNLAHAYREANNDAKSIDLLQEALEVVDSYLPRCRDSSRVLALVLKARIKLALNNDSWSRDSEDAARQAQYLARTVDNKASRAEAAIVLGEVLSMVPTRRQGPFDQTKDPHEWSEAIRCFTEAIGDRRDNLLARCASHLCLAELELKRYNILDAHKHLKAWKEMSAPVEHHWLRQKGALVEGKIAAYKIFLITPEDKRKFNEVSFSLVKFLVDREKLKQQGQPFDVNTAASNIGITVRTFHNWEAKIKDVEPVRIQIHQSRKAASSSS